MICTDTAYIPDLSVYIFSVTRTLIKGFKEALKNKELIPKKNATILKFEEHLYHGNDNGYIMYARLNKSPNNTGKFDK